MLASIMDDLTIMCDKIIDAYAEAKSNDEAKSNIKETQLNFNEKKATCKTQNFFILLAFLLITIALLIAVVIYCYLIKYCVNQNHLLPFYGTNNELKQVIY